MFPPFFGIGMKRETKQIIVDGVTYWYTTAGVPTSKKDGKVYLCDKCGFPYKGDQVVKFRGKIYCIPNTCSKDIPGILRKEKANYQSSEYSGRY